MTTEKSLYDALNYDLVKSPSDLIGSFEYLGHSHNSSGVKKNRSREDSDMTELHRSNKQLANNVDENESLEMYDDGLICSKFDSQTQTCSEAAGCKGGQSKGGPNRRGGLKKNKSTGNESIDLRGLLMQCAQAVSNFNHQTLNDLLLEIRQHSSPKGDGVERAAHYFANALEARIAGNGTALYAALNAKMVASIDMLKAFKIFVMACPFKHMSNILANRKIRNLVGSATTLHIIDFGIAYGCQWACLLHDLSQMPGGPPKLRITGIDFPQPGFRPDERVVKTGRRLTKYGERFGVPFEYNAIAQRWDTISLENLKIEKNELLVVNSMYRLHHVQDATETGYSPRDAVLNLIRKINPDMFIHGIVNGTYNSPFFVTRFKEAFFHIATMFDMFEAVIPKNDEERQLLEQQMFGREAMNIIACEGTERVERPEMYKHWQGRIVRAGFRQVRVNQEIVKHVKKVKQDYHEDFSVDEDGKWVLLGWKGRVVQGFSCWIPTQN
ncbi:hypothetical protein CASFOL_030385 [Castilleja foliolosa]|uniref:GRAS family transcription factor n=1 Tax=Castilleja foliolosa TaxID=1961234 RepID=A0ABD3C9U8_9LAMI